MSGQTMAQWLIDNKNGKVWKKYGKERVYINVYVGGMQVANYFYDIITDRFFGCDSKTEKAIRAEYEEHSNPNAKVVEETEATEEVVTEEAEVTEEVVTETKTKMKETASKISNKLQNKFKMEQKEAQKEVKEILKDFTLRIQGDFEKSEIKDMQADKRLSQFFQLQLLKYIYKELQKWIPKYKMIGGNFGIVEFVKKYNRVDFITDLVFNRNFEKLIKSIKNFIKKGGD